jgi:CRISPR-associated protein Cas2
MKQHKYIIVYDISCKKRLAKVHRLLKSQAIFLQESVYYWHGTQDDLDRLQAELTKRINKAEDDIRGYRLQSTQILYFFARSPLLTDSYFDDYPKYQHHPKEEGADWSKYYEVI